MAGPSVDLVLLRGLLPDIPLKPGSVVTGRVLDPKTLLLEGVRMQAQLPEGAEPGQRLRLKVEQASPERLHLRIVAELPSAQTQATTRAAATAQSQQTQDPDQVQAQQQAQQHVPVQVYGMALPGGVDARLYVVDEDEETGGGGGGDGRPVVIRYDSPSLGRLDIRLDSRSAAIHVPAGEPSDRVRAAASELRDALSGLRGEDVQVTIHPRLETYDARA